jgi:hypothetical protein
VKLAFFAIFQNVIFGLQSPSSTYDRRSVRTGHPVRKHEVSVLVHRCAKIQEDGCRIPGDMAHARDLHFT